MTINQQVLEDAIASAAREAFQRLFAEHPGDYYYCSLVTTGEAHPPVVSAWSREALAAAVEGEPDIQKASAELKWSYADSPYCGYGEEHFAHVKELFARGRT